MKNKFGIVCLIFLGLVLCNCKMNKEEKVEETPKIIKDFFNQYDTYNAEKAIDFVLNSNKWLKEIDRVQKDSLRTNLSEMVKELGKYYTYEVIKTSDIGDSYKVVSCIAKYEMQPIRFNFVLYKAVNEWQIQNFTYDLNMEEEALRRTDLSFE